MNELDWSLALDFVIKSVKDFRHGAQRRRDQEKWGSGEQVFFDGKVCAYDDVLSWLESKKKQVELDNAAPVE